MKKLFFVFLFVTISPLVFLQTGNRLFIKDSLENYIKRGLENWQIPGIAVCVVKNGKVEVLKGYGFLEMGKEDRVDENTLFMIGSNTKAFTGTALAWLEFENKCSLEDKVQKYLPDFTMKDPWIAKELNLVDIVSHRMGLETFQGDFMYWTSDLNSDEVIEKFGKLTPLYNFRTKYGYTNAGYAIAGKVIKQISGQSWEDYLKEKIFIPLKMNRTVPLAVDLQNQTNVAMPHTKIEGKTVSIPIPMIDNLAPCGSISSSVNDMSHWLIALLDSGKYENQQVIPNKVVQRTRKPESIQGRSRHPFNKTHFNLYGLGWGLMDYENREIVSHTGGVNGFVTSVTLLPEEKLGVVVLTNEDQNPFFQSLKWEIIDAYLGLPFRDYDNYFFERSKSQKEQALFQLDAWRDSVKLKLVSVVPLREFTGKYENEVYGNVEIKVKDDYLEMCFEHHSKLLGKLEYIGNDRFLCAYSDPTYGIKVLPFEVKEGKVISFQLYVDDFIEFTPYTFYKK
jgi:CubicO group peptidase (beta-lactamase class C family)